MGTYTVMTRAVLLLLTLLALLASPLAVGSESCCGQAGTCCPAGPCRLPGPAGCGTSARCTVSAVSPSAAAPTSPRPAVGDTRKLRDVPKPTHPARAGIPRFLRPDVPPRLAGSTSRFSTLLPPPGGADG